MKRNQFIKVSALLIGAAATPRTVHAAADDAVVLKQILADYYRIFFVDVDRDKYRALLTDDYLLLEHGDIKISKKTFRSCRSLRTNIGGRTPSISNH